MDPLTTAKYTIEAYNNMLFNLLLSISFFFFFSRLSKITDNNILFFGYIIFFFTNGKLLGRIYEADHLFRLLIVRQFISTSS